MTLDRGLTALKKIKNTLETNRFEGVWAYSTEDGFNPHNTKNTANIFVNITKNTAK